MCGGCGASGGRDWASGSTTSPAARVAVADAATSLCRAVDVAVRVDVGAGGWRVASPTGVVVVASTVTQLWAAVPAWPARVAERGLPPLAEVAGPWSGPVDTGHVPVGRRVAVLVGQPGAAELAWADVVVRGGSGSSDTVDAVDATAPGARVLVVCAGPGPARGTITALRAPGPAQRSSLTAAVARGGGPDWADDLDAQHPADVAPLLDGAVPAVAAGQVVTGGGHPAASACWVAAVVAGGGERSRLRVTTSAGLVVDVVERTVLGVRAVVPQAVRAGRSVGGSGARAPG